MAILALILGIIGAIIVGGAMILADKLGFYLIVLMPILGGAIIGFFVSLPYRNRKNEAVEASNLGSGLSEAMPYRDNRPAALPLILVALICALIASAVYWVGSYVVLIYDEYQIYQTEIMDVVKSDDPSLTDEEAQVLIAEFEMDETGSTGFIAFVKFVQEDLTFVQFIEGTAEAGISINRARGSSSSSSGLTLEGNILYAYWALEILLLIGFSISSTLGTARAKPEVPAEVSAEA